MSQYRLFGDVTNPNGVFNSPGANIGGMTPAQLAAAAAMSPEDQMALYSKLWDAIPKTSGSNGPLGEISDTWAEMPTAAKIILAGLGGGAFAAGGGFGALGAAGAGAEGAAGSSALDSALADGFASGTAAGTAGGTTLASAGGALDAGAAGLGAEGAGGALNVGYGSLVPTAGAAGGLTLPGAGAAAGGLGFASTPAAVGAFDAGIGLSPEAIGGLSTAAGGAAGGSSFLGGSGGASTALSNLATGGTGGPATAAGGTAATSAISRVLNGTATADDYLKLAGQALPGVIGAIGANQQSNALQGLADKYFAAGAPSRARYEASMTPGFDPTTIPGYSGAVDTTSEALLRKLSASGGNPFGNPGGLVEANKAIINGTALPAVQNYQNQNATAGGFATLNAAAPGAASSAVGANANVLNSLGGAAADVFSPPKTSLLDLLKGLNGGSGFSLA